MTTIISTSIVTCPTCGYRHEETMPEDTCKIRYSCRRCGTELRPKPGDCCVFCSYGTVPCPPIQRQRLAREPIA